MTILITDEFTTPSSKGATYTINKTSAFVSVRTDGSVNVCVLNASHRAYRRMGKVFSSLTEAINAYKSADMKAILSSVGA